MDPRAITLAQLDFAEFNEQIRVRGRSRRCGSLDRRVTTPQFPPQTIVRVLASGRSWISSLRVNSAARLGRQST